MERRKSEADPLSAMNKYLHVKSTSDTLTRPSHQQLAVVRAQLDNSRQERAMEEKIRAKERESKSEGETKSDKEKKHKDKRHKDKHRDKKDKRKDKEQQKLETLERLRRERMARENEERAQLQRLVQGPGGQSRGPSRDQYQSRAHHSTGTRRVERGGERMREDY